VDHAEHVGDDLPELFVGGLVDLGVGLDRLPDGARPCQAVGKVLDVKLPFALRLLAA
jgi:hypothetical protein